MNDWRDIARYAIVGEGLTTPGVIAEALDSLVAATGDPGTVMGLPRIFQAWARKP